MFDQVTPPHTFSALTPAMLALLMVLGKLTPPPRLASIIDFATHAHLHHGLYLKSRTWPLTKLPPIAHWNLLTKACALPTSHCSLQHSLKLKFWVKFSLSHASRRHRVFVCTVFARGCGLNNTHTDYDV